MSKFIMAALILGFLFWGLFVAKLIERIPADKQLASSVKESSLPSLDDLQKWMLPQPLPPQGLRDPFRPVTSNAPPSRKSPVAPPAPEAVKPMARPDIGIDAILPGDNPVAILRHNGETSIVRVGQVVWNVSIQAIGSNTVTLQVDGQSFVLQK